MTVHRVVAANIDGISKIVETGEPPRSVEFTAPKGLGQSLVWCTDPMPSLTTDGTDPTIAARSLVPPPGGTSLIVLTIPPDEAAYGDPSFDPVAAASEFAKHSPGIAESFDPDQPGMHTTPTIDYGILVDGELWIELTDGEVHLTTGDILVQQGTRHAWHNKSDKPATLVCVLVGATA